MISLLKTLTFLLGASFFAYIVFLIVPYLRHPRTVPGRSGAFDWHFMIPCRDEEAVVLDTIRNARRTFPQAHLWIIDDDSDDATGRLASECAATDDHVHVVARRRPDARTGKGAALNAAYQALNEWLPADTNRERVIVTVLDADGALAPDALDMVASPSVFGDPGMGAAQVAVWMKNRDDRRPWPNRGMLVNRLGYILARLQDIEFRTTIAAMQSLRTHTGTVGLGGNGQFTRLSLLDAINQSYGNPWHGALLEDYELGVHTHLAGYRVAHVYDTHVSQEALPSLRRFLTQRTRWAQGNIQCVKYIAAVYRSPNVVSTGLLEISYYLVLPFLQLCGFVAFAIMGTSIATNLITGAGGMPMSYLIAFAGFWTVFSVTPFALWGFVYKARCETSMSYLTAAAWGLGVSFYVLYMWAAIPRAFWRVAVGNTGWLKTRRNAERNVEGPTALDH